MDGERDGFAYLEELKQKNRGTVPSFSSFAMYLEEKARKQGVPLSGQFELTPLCNFRCGMCYVQLNGNQLSQPLLSADQWKELMSAASGAGMLRATLTGGECLAYPCFEEVYEHLQSLGCEVTVMTNGSLLDEQRVAYFLQHRPGMICITLYGNSEEAYERVTGCRAFEKTVSHIWAVRAAGLPLELSVTPNRLLGEDVFETIRLAKELSPAVRVNAWLTAPREETGRSEQAADLTEDDYIRIFRFRNELDGIPCIECPAEKLPRPGGPVLEGTAHGLQCGGGRSSFSISWKGVMSPCNELEMIKAYPMKTGFDPAWRIVHEAAVQWPRAKACEGCAYEEACVKCAGRLIQFCHPGERSPRLCEQILRFVQHGIYRIPDCE